MTTSRSSRGFSQGDAEREAHCAAQSDMADRYRHRWNWVHERGWMEIGRDGHLPSFARALDAGGLVWESKGRYGSLEDALPDLHQGITAWLQGNNKDEHPVCYAETIEPSLELQRLPELI
jgi:hypothetical protein